MSPDSEGRGVDEAEDEMEGSEVLIRVAWETGFAGTVRFFVLARLF